MTFFDVDEKTALLRIKAVPGASRDTIAGVLGDRLKIRITAPPEGGKANAAIITLLARALDVPKSAVTLERGQTHAEKSIRIIGVTRDAIAALAKTSD